MPGFLWRSQERFAGAFETGTEERSRLAASWAVGAAVPWGMPGSNSSSSLVTGTIGFATPATSFGAAAGLEGSILKATMRLAKRSTYKMEGLTYFATVLGEMPSARAIKPFDFPSDFKACA